MKSSKKKHRLTKQEKKGMLEESLDLSRRKDFRKARELLPKRSFEDYLQWLTEINEAFPPKARKPAVYKKVLL